jgi:hypothetical protein
MMSEMLSMPAAFNGSRASTALTFGEPRKVSRVASMAKGSRPAKGGWLLAIRKEQPDC